MFSVVSLLALAIIATGIYVAFSGRFLAVGALVLANIGVFILTAFGPSYPVEGMRGFDVPKIHVELALYGHEVTALAPIAGLRLVSSMFVHANALHIFGNMLMLVIFGLPFEERIGHRKFTIIYLLSGLVGSLVMVAYRWGDPLLLMGASGAVFGVLGGFGGAYPRERVRLPIPGPILFWVRAPVIVFAMIGAALQTLYQLYVVDNVAYMAHLGGMAGGLVLGFILVRRSELEQGVRGRTAVNFHRLEPFASDPRAHKALSEMERNQDEPEVFRAWVEEFFRHATDPETGEPVRPGLAGRIINSSGKVHDVRVREGDAAVMQGRSGRRR